MMVKSILTSALAISFRSSHATANLACPATGKNHLSLVQRSAALTQHHVVVTAAPNYQLFPSGADCEANGAGTLASGQDCESAAHEAGEEYYGQVAWSEVKGCFKCTSLCSAQMSGKYFWNPAGTGSCDSEYADCVCMPPPPTASPTSAPTAAPNYLLFPSGANCEANGAGTLVSAQDCELAAGEAGKEYVGQVAWSEVKGCFKCTSSCASDQRDKYYWNPAGTGSCDSQNAECVCTPKPPCNILASLEECKMHADAQQNLKWDGQRNWTDREPGCLKTKADGHVNWNRNGNGLDQNDDQEPLCA